MSAAATAAVESPAPSIVVSTVERIECVRCEAVIPPQNTTTHPLPNPPGIISRTVYRKRCLCPGCNTLFEFDRVAGGSFIGEPRVVTSPTLRAKFFKEIGKVTGDRQVE